MKTLQRPTLSLRICAVCALAHAAPALAQRAEDNAVTAAADAFGQAVGNERIGLYENVDVRGFSPIEVGNTRMEGLYYAPVDNPLSLIADSSTIRVGIAAQNYPFPAPTGIVDYALNLPNREQMVRVSLDLGQYGSTHKQVDWHQPLDDRIGIVVSVARRDQNRHEGGSFDYNSVGTVAAWRPYDGALVAAFVGATAWRDDEAGPQIYPAGNVEPPKIPRQLRTAQSWTDRNYNLFQAGMVTKLPVGRWRIEAGLFRSLRDYKSNYADIMADVQPDGSVPNRIIVIDPNNRDAAVSGEFRVVREFLSGALRHQVTASLRGRAVDRRFGGGQRVSLGPSTAAAIDERPEIILPALPDDSDRVRHASFGINYNLALPGRFAIDAGLSRARYSKTVDFAAVGRPDLTAQSDPWLGHISGSAYLTRRLVAYGGHVRGFEDPLVAPEIAVNRGDAPPALRTQQSEIGLRYAVTPRVNLIAGVFEISKPYYNLDSARVYRDLGTVRNRGIELSLAGSIVPGVAVVVGTVLFDPRILGDAVSAGLVGPRPVGATKRRSIVNLDWRLDAGKSPLSFDLSFDNIASRAGNLLNTLIVGGRSNMAVGARYRFELAGAPVLARVQYVNPFNWYGWNVSANGSFQYTRSRAFLAELQIDL